MVKASAIEFSTTEIDGKKITICRIDIRKDNVQLFNRDENGQPFKRFDRLAAWLQARGHTLLFAMNAGMYKADFSALGLFVSDGQQSIPLNTANGEGNFFLKPNGVFVITEAGATVVESSAYQSLTSRVVLATQSGPLLVYDGRINHAFNPNSKSRLFRNGVGVSSPDVAIFAISDDPVTFYEFATVFKNVLHCPNALFLDGTISSLYSTTLKRNDFRMDLGPIIAVVE
jgi:uncharacterized protein YigE (DUF2233 family)